MENLGIFYDHLVYFTAIGNILWSFGIFCGNLVYFVVIWYIFLRFGILDQEKSGNPGFTALQSDDGIHRAILVVDVGTYSAG
jgi:hypothetical protein